MKVFHRHSLILVFALLCATTLSSCNQDILTDRGRRPVDGVGPNGTNDKTVATVDYQEVNKLVLLDNCLKCHGADSAQSDLSTYAAVLKVVVPGNAAASPLFQSLQGAGFGGTMPRRAGPLAQEQIELIRNWINGGAIETIEISDGDPAETTPSTEASPSPSPYQSPEPSPVPSPEPAPVPVPPQPAPAPQPQVMKFDELKNIVLGPRCARCHSGDDARGDIKLDSYQEVFAIEGLVLPGDADKSLLYQVVRDNEMPPTKRGQPSMALSDAEKELIRKWIADGAQN